MSTKRILCKLCDGLISEETQTGDVDMSTVLDDGGIEFSRHESLEACFVELKHRLDEMDGELFLLGVT